MRADVRLIVRPVRQERRYIDVITRTITVLLSQFRQSIYRWLDLRDLSPYVGH
jgi:hypothetical protein